ncbi:MAG: phosphoenolpyruvate--protein phosphotransferase [Pseudomonadota bacterium]|nr:phosphoenolpyruvate--protein phosphotransferase [Pseudomonadota bacterium]
MSFQLFGLPVSRGVAIGRAVLVASSRIDVAHYYIGVDQIEAEIERLRAARDIVAKGLTTMKEDLPSDAPAELSALLDVHLMLLHDDTLSGATKHWIQERHYNAEWALSAQLEVLARQFDEMEDEYLRERKADLEQVVERLLGVLARGADGADSLLAASKRRGASGDPLVLVANDISPADMLHWKGGVFLGFVTDVGGKTSHTAIVARSMDIPAVVGAREASRLIRQDDWLIIDGDAGTVIVDPPPSVIAEYRLLKDRRDAGRAGLARLRYLPAITRDGEHVELLANIEQPGDAAAALEAGAVGIGLFRSEFLFMNRGGDLPGEDEQFEAYRVAVTAMKGLPVTIRTVDVGADKALDRMSANELRHEHALNPALGLRAIRWSLSEPAMFRQQLRAILRAAAFGKVRLLLPMVAHLSEVRQTVEALARARQQLDDSGRAYGPVEVGAMIEVPAAVLMLPAILRHFDFVSIGTNDLIQYTLAIDRADEAVAHLYNPWHPAVLQLIAQTIATARGAGKAVSVCGEMAGEPAFSELLLAMGLRSFSMHPSQIVSVKQRLLAAHAQRWSESLARILAADDPEAECGFAAASISGVGRSAREARPLVLPGFPA